MILGGQPPGKAGRRWGRLLTQKPLYSSLAQSVERMTVNHDVVGSSPTRGANLWPLGQVVKTPPFHGDNMGSNPVGVTTYLQDVGCFCSRYSCLINNFVMDL